MTDTREQLVQKLASALSENVDAKRNPRPRVEGDNPMDSKRLADLLKGAGYTKRSDMRPTQHKKYGGPVTYVSDLELAVAAQLDLNMLSRRQQRKSTHGSRTMRNAVIDQLGENWSGEAENSARMTAAWMIVGTLTPFILYVVDRKAAYASRLLGDLVEDVGMVALEKIARAIYQQDKFELPLLTEAADAIAITHTGRDHRGWEDKDKRKQVGKARKWIYQVTNRKAKDLISKAYRSERQLMENIMTLDIIDTTMDLINGVGEDPMNSRVKAKVTPGMDGATIAQPGKVDPHLLAVIINWGISARKLDLATQVLLDESLWTMDRMTFDFATHAKAIVSALPDGSEKWAVIRKVASQTQDPHEARIRMARWAVRREFAFLPAMVEAAVDAFMVRCVGYSGAEQTTTLGKERVTVRHAIMANALPANTQDHTYVRPQFMHIKLTWADALEAAEAIAEAVEDTLLEVDA